jgi:hypothetical protein
LLVYILKHVLRTYCYHTYDLRASRWGFPFTDLEEVAPVRPHLHKVGTQIALCQMETDFIEQLGQKTEEREGPIKLFVVLNYPWKKWALIQVNILMYTNSWECPETPLVSKCHCLSWKMCTWVFCNEYQKFINSACIVFFIFSTACIHCCCSRSTL